MRLAMIGVKRARECSVLAIDRLCVMRYAREVRRAPRIELADPRVDQLRPVRVSVVLCIGLGCGIAAALALAPKASPRTRFVLNQERDPPARGATLAAKGDAGLVARAKKPASPEPTPTVTTDAALEEAGAPDATVADAVAAPDPIATESAKAIELPPADLAQDSPTLRPRDEATTELARAPDDPRAATNNVPTAEAATQAIPRGIAAAARREIEPTAIAYIRCDGLERPSARFPCPRDRLFERRARALMQALPSCPRAVEIEPGEIELRLQLSRWGGVTEVSLRGSSQATERAVKACAEPALRELTSTLRARLAIVSFRFEVR